MILCVNVVTTSAIRGDCLIPIITWLRKESIAISTQCQSCTSRAHRNEKLKIALRLQFDLICQVTSSANSFNRTEFSTDWTSWIVVLTSLGLNFGIWRQKRQFESKTLSYTSWGAKLAKAPGSALLALWACPTKHFKQRSYRYVWSLEQQHRSTNHQKLISSKLC